MRRILIFFPALLGSCAFLTNPVVDEIAEKEIPVVEEVVSDLLSQPKQPAPPPPPAQPKK